MFSQCTTAGLGQCVAAGAQRAQRHQALGQAAQFGNQLGGDGLLDIDAAADKHNVGRANALNRQRGRHGQAVAGGHGLAVHAGQGPFVDVLLGDTVGHAQGLDRAGERD
jgi:hypothetical protein